MLDLHRDLLEAGLRETPRMLTSVLNAAEQLNMWQVADQVLTICSDKVLSSYLH